VLVKYAKGESLNGGPRGASKVELRYVVVSNLHICRRMGKRTPLVKGIVCSSHIRRVVGCPVWAELWLWWRVKVCLLGVSRVVWTLILGEGTGICSGVDLSLLQLLNVRKSSWWGEERRTKAWD
jgi:hypothetical protein